jgi:hypothetical protein
MAEVRYAAGVPTAASFAGLGAPTQCAPIVVDSTTGTAYTLKTGDVVVAAAAGGNVVGPASAVDGNVAVFDGTSGQAIKDGGTLGTAAYTASTDYDVAGAAAAAQTASQPLNTKLTSISALASASGWLHNNGAGVFVYSTPTAAQVGAPSGSGTCSGTNTGDQTITLTGEATGSGASSFAVTLTNSAVIGKVLTGYASGAGVVAATDTILQAIQKLNGNDATNANLTGPIISVGNATSIASQTGTGTKFAMSAGPTFTGTVAVDIMTATQNGTVQAILVNTDAGVASQYSMYLQRNASIVGSITTTNVATAFNTSSDARLKADKGVATSTDVLKQTVIHDFDWLVGGADRGVFAQEAVLIKPTAVTEGGDDEKVSPWGVDYSKYVPDLIVGWQDHEARICRLERVLAANGITI